MADQNEIYLMLGEVRAGVKQLLEASERQEQRVSALEKSKNFMLGAAGVIGAGASGAVALAIKHLP